MIFKTPPSLIQYGDLFLPVQIDVSSDWYILQSLKSADLTSLIQAYNVPNAPREEFKLLTIFTDAPTSSNSVFNRVPLEQKIDLDKFNPTLDYSGCIVLIEITKHDTAAEYDNQTYVDVLLGLLQKQDFRVIIDDLKGFVKLTGSALQFMWHLEQRGILAQAKGHLQGLVVSTTAEFKKQDEPHGWTIGEYQRFISVTTWLKGLAESDETAAECRRFVTDFGSALGVRDDIPSLTPIESPLRGTTLIKGITPSFR